MKKVIVFALTLAGFGVQAQVSFDDNEPNVGVKLTVLVEELNDGCGESLAYIYVDNYLDELVKLENLPGQDPYPTHARNMKRINKELEKRKYRNYYMSNVEARKFGDCGNQLTYRYSLR
ncbi:MAG: hypothetical protein Salg2KO_10930 [Salibacteraceae bacterium]